MKGKDGALVGSSERPSFGSSPRETMARACVGFGHELSQRDKQELRRGNSPRDISYHDRRAHTPSSALAPPRAARSATARACAERPSPAALPPMRCTQGRSTAKDRRPLRSSNRIGSAWGSRGKAGGVRPRRLRMGAGLRDRAVRRGRLLALPRRRFWPRLPSCFKPPRKRHP
jgi:hypothetical protein